MRVSSSNIPGGYSTPLQWLHTPPGLQFVQASTHFYRRTKHGRFAMAKFSGSTRGRKEHIRVQQYVQRDFKKEKNMKGKGRW